MRRGQTIGRTALLLALAASAAAAKPRPPHYLKPGAVDWEQLLHDGPPATGSEAERKEVATVLQWQEKRTPTEVARCKHEDAVSPFTSFSDVVGDGFQKKGYPVTAELFKNVERDALYVADTAKDHWDRPRPPLVDPRIKPCVAQQKNGSFPSSHAARGVVYAAVLAELFPEKKRAILARGEQIGLDRVIAGIHFPSDVEAGQKIGKATAEKLMADPAFRADLDRAKAECRATPAATATTRP